MPNATRARLNVDFEGSFLILGNISSGTVGGLNDELSKLIGAVSGISAGGEASGKLGGGSGGCGGGDGTCTGGDAGGGGGSAACIAARTSTISTGAPVS